MPCNLHHVETKTLLLVMKQFAVLFLLTLAFKATGQTTPAAIVAEGKKLYRSEAASWFGTDIFVEKFKNKRELSGGYLSYSDASGAKCIFFSKEPTHQTVAVITFDSTYNVQRAKIDSLPRALTKYEADLLEIRTKALARIEADTLFKEYKNTNLNVVPMIDKSERRVYVLSGPEIPNVIVFGNDYQIDFNTQNEIISTRSLHKNIMPVDYKANNSVAGFHSHLPSTGDYITPTDICTLMLYENFPGWGQYYVMSKNYVSIWNCKKNELFIMTRKAWERMSKELKKRSPESPKE